MFLTYKVHAYIDSLFLILSIFICSFMPNQYLLCNFKTFYFYG